MTDKALKLIERLVNEADLCRNDGANDIAALLDEAAKALAAPVQEPKLPEFFAELEYNSPDWDVFACVYRRRADATPELVHREQLPRQAPAAQPEQEPVACLSKTQAKAILDLALDLEKTGRMVVLTEGQERTDFAARNRNIQCALEDALRNATTPPTAPVQPKQEPVAFFDWYDNAHWGNEDFKEGCHRSWNAAIKYTTPPAPAQPAVPDFKAFKAWANDAGYDTAYTHDGIKWICLNPMTADLWKAWQAAHGITKGNTP